MSIVNDFWTLYCPLVPDSPTLYIAGVGPHGSLELATLADNPISGYFNENTSEITFYVPAGTWEAFSLTYQFDGYVWTQPLGTPPPRYMAGFVQTIWTPLITSPTPFARAMEPAPATPAPPTPPPVPATVPVFGPPTTRQGWSAQARY